MAFRLVLIAKNTMTASTVDAEPSAGLIDYLIMAQKFLKLAWLSSCLAVLLGTLIVCGKEANPTLRGECALLGGGAMVLLTFPLGFLWLSLVSAAKHGLFLLGIEIESESVIADIIMWFGFVGLGYFQWFMLVPRIVRYIRERRRK
jgi:hypothetical protein